MAQRWFACNFGRVDESDNQCGVEPYRLNTKFWGAKNQFFFVTSIFKGAQAWKFWSIVFTLITPSWLGDLQTDPKNRLFYHSAPDFDGFLGQNWSCCWLLFSPYVSKIIPLLFARFKISGFELLKNLQKYNFLTVCWAMSMRQKMCSAPSDCEK